MTGSGTLADPYIIWDVNDLQDMNLDLTAYYELGQDIDASATATWNWNAVRGVFEGFDPVGTTANPFEGHLHGRFHSITGLHIDRNVQLNTGLFGYVWRGAGFLSIIQYVRVINADVSGIGSAAGRLAVGIMVGHCQANTRFHCCYVSGSVYGQLQGAAGHTCCVGGFVGYADSTIQQCGANVSVHGHTPGANNTVYAGGFVGTGNAGEVNDSYARGNVHGTSDWFSPRVGGFCSILPAFGGGTYLRRNFSTGTVTGACVNGVTRGGFIASVGAYAARVIANFWDMESSGLAVSAGGTGLTTAQAKTEATYTAAGWNFATVWTRDTVYGYWNGGYPHAQCDAAPYIYLTIPNGGENWFRGNTYTILWTHVSETREADTHVSLELLKGGVLDEVIIASTPIGPPGGGNYAWTINANKEPGPDYRVRVTGTTHPFTDQSDNDFNIRAIVIPPAPAVATLPATGVG